MKQVVIAALACFALATGCRDSSPPKANDHGHSHGPPHGGTPVVVAEHKYHLELVRDSSSGLMQAYVLDDELHDFIRVPETNFTLMANVGGKTERLDFVRATNSASPGLSAPSFLFEARADWVKAAANFDGMVPSITLNGQTFTNIAFPFPKGTQHTH
jgi:hypothetical protein